MSGRSEIDRQFKIRNENRLKAELPDCVKRCIYSRVDLSVRTMNTYIGHICVMLKTLNKHVLDITKSDLEEYFYNLEYESSISKSSLAQKHAAFSLLYEYLYENKYIQTNPMQGIKRAKTPMKTEGREDYLTESELHKYLYNLENDITTSEHRGINNGEHERNTAIIMLFLYTGMRCSALCELSLNDLDFENKTVSIITKGQQIHKFEVRKWFDLYLEPYLEIRKRYETKSKALFLSCRGRRLCVQSISSIVEKYTTGIKKHITPHKLRATFATSLYDKGVDMLTISKCLRHKNVGTTSIYIRGFRNDSKIGADVMDKIIGG